MPVMVGVLSLVTLSPTAPPSDASASPGASGAGLAMTSARPAEAGPRLPAVSTSRAVTIALPRSSVSGGV